MYNTKFILESGIEIYPGYLDEERRKEIKDLYTGKRMYMWCGCKNEDRIYYRISEDLRIYPEHNKSVHDHYCSRYRTESGEEERKTGYVINEEDGEVIAYLSFNPKNLVENDRSESEECNPDLENMLLETEEQEVLIEADKGKNKTKEKKEPKLSLASLIRSINIDTFTEKAFNNRKITTRENFNKYVYFRMKKVKISRMKKAIGDLTLEKDGVRFIYLPFAGALKKEERGVTKCYFCSNFNGKVINNFIYPDTMKKAIKDFIKAYGIEPDENTMLAGFQYLKKTKSGVPYKVLGRVHLFQVSNTGIYIRSISEKNTYDLICKIIDEDERIKFWIPADDESIGGIIQREEKMTKILLLFRTSKNECVTFDRKIYIPIVVGEEEPIDKKELYKIMDEMI